MRAHSFVLAALAGGVFATTLLLACSDDSTGDADAAVCDCPAAEPPLAGRIIVATRDFPVPPGGGSQTAGCPVGSTLLGGGCTLIGAGDLVLRQAGPNRQAPTTPGYSCSWASNAPADVEAHIEAICLVPAP